MTTTKHENADIDWLRRLANAYKAKAGRLFADGRDMEANGLRTHSGELMALHGRLLASDCMLDKQAGPQPRGHIADCASIYARGGGGE